MGELPIWVGVGLTFLSLLAGCVAYIHTQLSSVHTRVSTTREWAEQRMGVIKEELREDIKTERDDRRREHERLTEILDGFREVGKAVVGLTEGVKYLGERFEEHRRSTERAMDDIKRVMGEERRQ